MRRPLVLVLVALILAALPLQAGPQMNLSPYGIAPEARKWVKASGDLIKSANSLHVEATIVTEVERYGNRRVFKAEVTYDVQSPNLFALRTRQAAKDNAGLDVVCDGDRLVRLDKLTGDYGRYRPRLRSEMSRFLIDHLLPVSQTGMLFQNIVHEDPYEELMGGVESCWIAGIEQVDGVDAYHIRFVQPYLQPPGGKMLWALWIAAKGPPVVLKAASTHKIVGGTATTTETYRHWKFDEPASADAFKLPPEPPAKPVDSSAPAAATAKSTGGSTPKRPAWLPGRAPGVQ